MLDVMYFIPKTNLCVDHRLCISITWIIHQQLWGYKAEEKLHLGVREQKRLNTNRWSRLLSASIRQVVHHRTPCWDVFRRVKEHLPGQRHLSICFYYCPTSSHSIPGSFKQTFTQACVTSSWAVSNVPRSLGVSAILHHMTPDSCRKQSPLPPDHRRLTRHQLTRLHA
jgi:hypothetical protein